MRFHTGSRVPVGKRCVTEKCRDGFLRQTQWLRCRRSAAAARDSRSKPILLLCKSVVSKLVDVKSELRVSRRSCAELAAIGICSSTNRGRCVFTQAPEIADVAATSTRGLSRADAVAHYPRQRTFAMWRDGPQTTVADSSTEGFEFIPQLGG